MDNNQSEYLSLKDIFLKIGDYFGYVKSKFLFLILGGFIIGGLISLKTMLTIPMYNEQLTFMMDESQGDQLKGMNILDGLFGKSSSDNNLGKILQLFESKRIIHNTLFDTITIEGKKDFLANHMLAKYGLKELTKNYRTLKRFSWIENWPQELFKHSDFRFKHGNTDNFDNVENQFLRILYEKITGNAHVGFGPQLVSSMNEESGIMTLSMSSEYEEFTLAILNRIYTQLSGFFIEKSTEKQAKTFRIMNDKMDSVVYALKRSEYKLADFKDRNRNLVTVKGYLDQVKLERDVTVLNTMYAEVVKQMEMTDFALKNKTPVVQIIDLPRSPIVPTDDSWKRELIKGFLIGLVLATFILLLRKMFTDIMSS